MYKNRNSQIQKAYNQSLKNSLLETEVYQVTNAHSRKHTNNQAVKELE